MDTIAGLLHSWGYTLWVISWQITIIFGFISLISIFCRKASSVFRYWLWCILLFRLCIPFELTIPMGFQNTIEKCVTSLPLFFVDESSVFNLSNQSISNPEFFSVSQELAKKGSTSEYEKSTTITRQDRMLSGLSLFMIISLFWFVSVIVMGILIVWHTVRNHNLFKGCPVIERPELNALLRKLCSRLNIKQSVELRSVDCSNVFEPSVVGVFKPAIYLSRRMIETWRLEDIEPILMHELTHVRRRDNLVNWLQIAVQILYFFHPLVWYANWKIRQLREDVCDDIALNGDRTERISYTEKMLRVIKESNSNISPTFLLIGFADTKNSLAKRIVRILKSKYPLPVKLTRLSVVLLGLIALMGIALSSGRSENTALLVLNHSLSRDMNADRVIFFPLDADDYKGNKWQGYVNDGADKSGRQTLNTFRAEKKNLATGSRTIASDKNENSRISSRLIPPAMPAMPISAEVERIADDSKMESSDFDSVDKTSLDIPAHPDVETGRAIGTGAETDSGAGGISVEPRLIKGVFPVIPERLKGKKIQGETELKVKINENGSVIDVRIIKNTTNSEEIAQAAAEAAFKCVYIPAMSGNKANMGWTTWRLRFNSKL